MNPWLERLEAFMEVISPGSTSRDSWMRPAEAALVEAEAESEVHEPGDLRKSEQSLLTWHGWAVPAILEVLAEPHGIYSNLADWQDHIAPLIADRIACDPQRAIEALSREQRIEAGYRKLAKQEQTPEGQAEQKLHRARRRMPS